MLEFIIPRRPLSHQTRNRANLQAWKAYVEGIANFHWTDPLILDGTDLRLTLVYLCDDSPADIDNIIKPIQDAMVGVVYEDDIQISDVDSHRRYLTDTIVITGLPQILADAVAAGDEAVYVKVENADELGVYL
ncbi:RusA family crossover junction endodeoxyribonuclease [filamentous cyanobacterium LEGE 11480]|uniref:RusA family crossover junction endodeoxyribonuclease n=1 Tax=Romeriopsis navalis LEGE 11480 TaxID=2777977 RepID=A0A928Z431_9CYAN|nr:RusA family crossover junction endodeoxyribonuclease [Romeriopsis navalis]MBE9030617.1 RusA family crossover junction endodeoxyribonuclease [Romeriopsis navalis LEGE 11480]